MTNTNATYATSIAVDLPDYPAATVTFTSTVSGGDVRTMTPPWTGAVVLYVYHEGGG